MHLAGRKGGNARGIVVDDKDFDTIDVTAVFVPVIFILRKCDADTWLKAL